MCGHSFICGKKHCADSEKRANQAILHCTSEEWQEPIEPSQHTNTPLTPPNSPLAFPPTSWLYFVCGFFFLRACSALVLFLSLPPSVLSSPPLTGARALDHCCERTIGSRRTTWPLNRGSAHRDSRSREQSNTVKIILSEPQIVCLIENIGYVFPYHLFFSFILMEKETNILCMKPKYPSLLPPAGGMQLEVINISLCDFF